MFPSPQPSSTADLTVSFRRTSRTKAVEVAPRRYHYQALAWCKDSQCDPYHGVEATAVGKTKVDLLLQLLSPATAKGGIHPS